MAIKKFPLNNICLEGSIELSGDKSISIRTILLSAWAPPSMIFIIGLDGVSIHIIHVFFFVAATTVSNWVIST